MIPSNYIGEHPRGGGDNHSSSFFAQIFTLLDAKTSISNEFILNSLQSEQNVRKSLYKTGSFGKIFADEEDQSQDQVLRSGR